MDIFALYNPENDSYVGQDFVEFQEYSETILRPVDSNNLYRSILCTTDSKHLESLLQVAETVYNWKCYEKALIDYYCEIPDLNLYKIVKLTPEKD
jgi:hypothetical protein